MSEHDDLPEDEQGTLLPEIESPNAADPVSIAKARRRKKSKEDEYGNFWRMVLGLDIGRKVMWDLINGAGVFSSSFAHTPAGFPSNEKTWFHLGQKEFGERLYHTLIKHDPDAAMKMLRENHHHFALPPKPRMRTTDG